MTTAQISKMVEYIPHFTNDRFLMINVGVTWPVLQVRMVDISHDEMEKWKSNSAFLQTDLSLRKKWYEHAKKCFNEMGVIKKSKGGVIADSEEFLHSLKIVNYNDDGGILGKGNYGVVFRAVFLNEKCNYVPIALKMEKYSDLENFRPPSMSLVIEKAINSQKNDPETICGKVGNELMETSKSIHFPFLLSSVVGVDAFPKKFSIMEYADGTLDLILKKEKVKETSTYVYFNVYLQILMSLIHMGDKYMIHNDLYPRNVLINHTQKNFTEEFSINMYKKNRARYFVKTTNAGYIYKAAPSNVNCKISDFGLCWQSGMPTERLSKFFAVNAKDQQNWEILLEVHLTSFIDVPIFLRDLLSITGSFYSHLRNFPQHKEFSSYLAMVMSYFFELIKNDDTKHLNIPSGLTGEIQYILSNLFLPDYIAKQLKFERKVVEIVR